MSEFSEVNEDKVNSPTAEQMVAISQALSRQIKAAIAIERLYPSMFGSSDESWEFEMGETGRSPYMEEPGPGLPLRIWSADEEGSAGLARRFKVTYVNSHDADTDNPSVEIFQLDLQKNTQQLIGLSRTSVNLEYLEELKETARDKIEGVLEDSEGLTNGRAVVLAISRALREQSETFNTNLEMDLKFGACNQADAAELLIALSTAVPKKGLGTGLEFLLG